MIEVLKAKIHRATVTRTDLDYEGSITIDGSLMRIAGIREFEAVEVYDISSGARFKTYAIKGSEESGEICINGAAARLAYVGDLVIVVSYRFIDDDADIPKPVIVKVDSSNKPVTRSNRK